MKQKVPFVSHFFPITVLILIGSIGCGTSGAPPSALQISASGALSVSPSPVPTSIPTVVGPDQYQTQLLDLINASRGAAGLPPYVFSLLQSSGSATCVGSLGHSIEMSKEGAISHDQFTQDICLSFSSAGENVGYTSGVSENDGITETHVAMMNEGPTGGHYQNIMSTSFTSVGIGLYVDSSGTLWLTEDFIEP